MNVTAFRMWINEWIKHAVYVSCNNVSARGVSVSKRVDLLTSNLGVCPSTGGSITTSNKTTKWSNRTQFKQQKQIKINRCKYVWKAINKYLFSMQYKLNFLLVIILFFSTNFPFNIQWILLHTSIYKKTQLFLPK